MGFWGIQSRIEMSGLSRDLTRAHSVPMFSIVVTVKVCCLASGLKSSPLSVWGEQAYVAKGKVSSWMIGLSKPVVLDTGRRPVLR